MKIYAAKTCNLQASEAKQLCLLLDRDRRQKVSALKSSRQQERSIFAGLLLRYAFLQAGYDIEAWQQVEIGKGTYGKPYIIGHQEFHYGLSHSGDWVVCAVDRMPVGIDLQEIKPWKLSLAKRFYHEEEYNRLLALGETEPDRQTQEFYRMWTAKESAVKLSGRGIGAGISQYVTAGDDRSIYDQNQQCTLGIRQYDILEGYMICLCSNAGDFPGQIEQIALV